MKVPGSAPADPARIPVIAGIGESVCRERDPRRGMQPLALMEQALRAAALEAGLAPARIESLDVVCEVSWPYADAPGSLARMLGMQPRHAAYGPIGGETPLRLVHEAALRIADGAVSSAAVVGAEAAYTVAAALRQGVELDWPVQQPLPVLERGRDFLPALAVQHGVFTPTHVYPFYENAAGHAWGQTPAQAYEESVAVLAQHARAAAANPCSWQREPPQGDAIGRIDADNRMIAWPYPKRMVANPQVNQGAAVVLTSLALARRLGLAEDRLVYLHGGAAAREPRNYLDRPGYAQAEAQTAVLRAVASQARAAGLAIGHAELYSCFPCVPKMARRILGMDAGAATSVTGGLSFFGAPLNNYMTHALAAMTRALRAAGNPQATGLAYGQGEFVTKHHALLLSRAPGSPAADYSIQTDVDARRAASPPFVPDHRGPAAVETYTVAHARDGSPEYGAVILRTPQGARTLARVDAGDTASMACLTDWQRYAIGVAGRCYMGADGLLRWTVQA